jgi:hypothetical protein
MSGLLGLPRRCYRPEWGSYRPDHGGTYALRRSAALREALVLGWRRVSGGFPAAEPVL